MRDLQRGDLPADGGFTLVEVMVSIVLFGIVSVIGTVGFRNYQLANEQESGAQALASTLRNAQVRAAAEGRTYCVRIGSDNMSWSVWRTACGSGTKLGTGTTRSPRVTLPAAGRQFTDRTGATSTTDISFYRSGMASAGSLTVARSGSSKVYQLTVEGLTSRVSLS